MTPTPDTTPAAVEAMCERLERRSFNGLVHTNLDGPEAAAMLREVATARANWSSFALDVTRKLEAAEAEAAALREALREIDGLVVMEINPSNYNHDDVCELSRNASDAAVIARAALKGSGHG